MCLSFRIQSTIWTEAPARSNQHSTQPKQKPVPRINEKLNKEMMVTVEHQREDNEAKKRTYPSPPRRHHHVKKKGWGKKATRVTLEPKPQVLMRETKGETTDHENAAV